MVVREARGVGAVAAGAAAPQGAAPHPGGTAAAAAARPGADPAAAGAHQGVCEMMLPDSPHQASCCLCAIQRLPFPPHLLPSDCHLALLGGQLEPQPS